MQYLIYMCPSEHKLLMCILWSINHKHTFRNRHPWANYGYQGSVVFEHDRTHITWTCIFYELTRANSSKWPYPPTDIVAVYMNNNCIHWLNHKTIDSNIHFLKFLFFI